MKSISLLLFTFLFSVVVSKSLAQSINQADSFTAKISNLIKENRQLDSTSIILKSKLRWMKFLKYSQDSTQPMKILLTNNNIKKKLNLQEIDFISGWLASDKMYKEANELGYVNGTRIDFFGSGAIQTAITNKESIPATAGLGVMLDKIFEQKTNFLGIKRIQLSAIINVASNLDTIASTKDSTKAIVNDVRKFGYFMLLPINSGKAASINSKIYFDPSKVRNKLLSITGMNISIVGSSRVWSFRELDKNGKILPNLGTSNSTVISIRAGVFHEFVPSSLKSSKDFSVVLGIDFSYRWLLGDVNIDYAINGKIKDNNAKVQEVFLGVNKWKFYGVEPYLAIRLKNLKAEVSLPHLLSTTTVKGLTDGQLVTSISFVGGFPIRIDSKE